MLALLLLACAGKPDGPEDSGESAEDLAETLPAPGPHPVGYAERSVLTADPLTGEARSLRIAVFYPAAAAEGETPSFLGGLVSGEGIYTEAPPRAAAAPLAVYSHGHQGYAEASSFLAAHLASHGWVVAAPDHTGNTTFDSSDRATAIYYLRPLDLRAVIDQMAASAEWEVEPNDVLLLGHSFGGYGAFASAGAAYSAEALAACEPPSDDGFCSSQTAESEALFASGELADPRVLGMVAMAPGDHGLFEGPSLGSLQAPVLHLTGSIDPSGGDNEAYWADLSGGAHRRVDLTGGGHLTFTDVSGRLEQLDGLIEPTLGWDIVKAYTLAWARHLQGDEAVSALLDGEAALYDEARLLR